MIEDFTFSAPLEHHFGHGERHWHLVMLPKATAKKIDFFAGERRGFGSIKVMARIGETEWKTSIFPDRKAGSFFLLINAKVIKAEGLKVAKRMKVRLSIIS